MQFKPVEIRNLFHVVNYNLSVEWRMSSLAWQVLFVLLFTCAQSNPKPGPKPQLYLNPKYQDYREGFMPNRGLRRVYRGLPIINRGLPLEKNRFLIDESESGNCAKLSI